MRHVVLDTEVFRRENLSFESPRFERLADLVEEGEIEVHVTDVIVEEVRRAIVDQVRAGIAVLHQESTRRALNVIAQGGVPKLKELLKGVDQEELESKLLKEFDSLLDRLDADQIATDDVPMKEVRERYFKTLPPFGHKLDKKHEFPDAISIIAVEKWAAEQAEPVLVVSADKGIAAAVKEGKNLKHVNDLRDVIDVVQRLLQIVDDPDALLKAKEAEIVTRVTEDFENSGFYVDGEWGEVTDVSVEKVELGSAYLAERHGDVVTLEFDAKVTYSAELSFDDPEQTAYDSETGETFVFGSVSNTVRESKWLEGEVAIAINSTNISRSKLNSVSIFVAGGDIGVPPPREPDYK